MMHFIMRKKMVEIVLRNYNNIFNTKHSFGRLIIKLLFRAKEHYIKEC